MSAFISEWCISDPYERILDLPLIPLGTYDFDIDWGDGSTEHINSNKCSHSYNKCGRYIIIITGIIKGWKGGDDKLRDIRQWGCLKLGNNGEYFADCRYMNISATDAPDLSETTNLSRMFNWCSMFNSDISHWDVSNVTDMSLMFNLCTRFNKPLNNWNMSNVINVYAMFSLARSFNQPLDRWDVSHIIDMSRLFYHCAEFNQDISMWNISSQCNTDDMYDACNLSNSFRPNKVSSIIIWTGDIYTYTEPCSICYTDISQADWRATQCSGSTAEHYHAFHKECIEEWIKTHNTCPYCRESI